MRSAMQLEFTGFIKDVKYQCFLASSLQAYSFDSFDINTAEPCGKVVFDNGEVAFSKWVSPKRTRSYPFERLYNTFNSLMRVTVIPVIKDEGVDGDFDRIQYATISWMNLLNVYIVLAYYNRAERSTRDPHSAKITNQQFDAALVNAQLGEISSYKQSALHWNRTLFQDRFVELYTNALDSYERISLETGVKMHDRVPQERYLDQVKKQFEAFITRSMQGMHTAAARESMTHHQHEYLTEGFKAQLRLENFLGGQYDLTVDEVIWDRNDGCYVIQESKNSTTGFLPKLPDIRDGLFRLILYSNIAELRLNSTPVPFKARLKLTGRQIRGALLMPCDDAALQLFIATNAQHCSDVTAQLLHNLNQEAKHNRNLEVHITPNVD